MTNKYIPLSVRSKLSEVYEFMDRVTEQSNLNDYYEAMVEMMSRASPQWTEHERQVNTFEWMRRCIVNNGTANPIALEWLEALRPEGHISTL